MHGTPACLAAYATPCPALPALIVQTPRFRSESGNIATALAAQKVDLMLNGFNVGTSHFDGIWIVYKDLVKARKTALAGKPLRRKVARVSAVKS